MDDMLMLRTFLATQFYIADTADVRGLPMDRRPDHPVKSALSKADALIDLALRTPGPKVDANRPRS